MYVVDLLGARVFECVCFYCFVMYTVLSRLCTLRFDRFCFFMCLESIV